MSEHDSMTDNGGSTLGISRSWQSRIDDGEADYAGLVRLTRHQIYSLKHDYPDAEIFDVDGKLVAAPEVIPAWYNAHWPPTPRERRIGKWIAWVLFAVACFVAGRLLGGR